MKRIAWITTFLGVVLLACGCRPAPEEPSNTPPNAVESEVAAPQPADPPDVAGPPEAPAGEAEKPKVINAVGKALFKSLIGDTEEEQPPEAPPFKPQLRGS